MTAQPRRSREHIDDNGLAALLWEGRGHGRCYDVFAPALYRYCWTLLGPRGGAEDAPGAAVHQALLAAVELLPQLRDRGQFRPWLFALARAACQRRGFAAGAPYAALPATPEERLIVDTMLRLPPSQRELLELSLRHGLSHTQIAAVLGLDPETVSELCRSAVHRAADLLTEHSAPAGGRTRRWVPTDLPRLLGSVALPGPPRQLREQVVADLAAPEAAARRGAAGAAVRPLGPDGFPLQRARGENTPVSTEDVPFDATEQAPAPPGERTAVLGDRAAASDPDRSRAAEAPGGPAAATHPAEGDSDERDRRSRWLVPAAAGLATALVAFSLWGLGAFLREAPDTTTAGVSLPSGGVTATPMSEHIVETAEPHRAPVSEPSAPAQDPVETTDEVAPPTQEPAEGAGTPDTSAPHTPAPAPEDGQEETTAPPDPESEETHGDDPQQEPTGSPQESGGGGLLNGLLGLLGLEGRS